jgi:hypothetical protein
MTTASEYRGLLCEIREVLIISGDESKYRKLIKKIDALHLEALLFPIMLKVKYNVYSPDHVPGYKKIGGVYHPWANLTRFYNE